MSLNHSEQEAKKTIAEKKGDILHFNFFPWSSSWS